MCVVFEILLLVEFSEFVVDFDLCWFDVVDFFIDCDCFDVEVVVGVFFCCFCVEGDCFFVFV